MSDELTCRELAHFLGDYVAGELPAAERARFDDHLAECDDCLVYLRAYEETIRAGKAAFASTDDAPVPRDVPEQLVQAILAARRKRP
jgi:anti-sigma factor RsiW